MLMFVLNAEKAIVGVVESRAEALNKFGETFTLVMRHDWKTFESAEQFASLASDWLSRTFIATDAGSSCWPRFDVIEAPNVGDEVSFGFNGDFYPCGTITKISASLKVITTSTGDTFYRRRQSGTWKKKGGTWSLVNGHHNERNPSF